MPRNLFGTPVSQTGKILGCTSCPIPHQKHESKKVKGLVRITGRRAMVWAEAPGPHEDKKGEELVGLAGQFLWENTRTFGLDKKDFDIQNVVRCMPRDDHGHFRAPNKKELECCSVYNEEAIERNRHQAQVHLILGNVAQQQLLGKDFRKDRPIFWHNEWNAYVVRNQHPSAILRQDKERGKDYYSWRDRLRAVAAILKYPGRWGYLKAQNYETVKTLPKLEEMRTFLRKEARAGRRVSFDVEDDSKTGGRHRLLLAGFGTGQLIDRIGNDPILYFKDQLSGGTPSYSWKGKCYSVVLDHPENEYSPGHLKAMQEGVKEIIEDPEIRKTLQNGSYDEEVVRKTLGATLRGYEYDTRYGTFLRYSFLRSCSLANLTAMFFPEFCDYKDIVEKWETGGEDGGAHFADAPLKNLLLRNQGDCDVTQRLEQRFGTGAYSNQPLVEIYIHAAKTLELMNKRGPLLDRENWEKADKAVPPLIEKLNTMLEVVTGIDDFDCNSPKKVADYLYDVLGLPQPLDKVRGEHGRLEMKPSRSTNKTTLEYLQATCENQQANASINLINRHRVLTRLKTTYLTGFDKSAEKNEGELHTVWWLTGTVTGRLRSGKGDRAESEGILNMQNLANNPLLQNLVVSDKNWRRALVNPK